MEPVRRLECSVGRPCTLRSSSRDGPGRRIVAEFASFTSECLQECVCIRSQLLELSLDRRALLLQGHHRI